MAIPILLVPGLGCTAEIFKFQLPALWQHGPVTIANHTEGESMAEIAGAVLADAPPTFALAGFSMGGYLAFEILRQGRGRVTRLALLDTSARPDTPESSQKRRDAIALAEKGKYAQAVAASFPNAVHPDNRDDGELRALHTRMSLAVGPDVYIRQQRSIMSRPDSRPDLATIDVPTLVVVGEADALTTPEAAREMANGITGTKLVEVPKAGHMALAERPDVVTQAMQEWLA